jgi:hypothetical protein
MTEQKVTYATVRASSNDGGEDCWDIECRFEDGQKYAPIQVYAECEELAHRIAKFLTDGTGDIE